MARLYSNENFPRTVVESLKRLGHDVLTTQDAGKAGQGVSDEEVLAFAVFESRAVLTFNRKDFRRLHLSEPNHSGIIICTFDDDFDNLARRIDESITGQSELAGQLIRVNRPDRATP